MTYRDLCVEGSKGSCCGGGGIAMNEDYIRSALLKHITKTGEDACSYIGEVLTLLHDVEVVIRGDIKNAKHLVEHLTMLTCNAYYGLELLWSALEFFDQRTHFDCLWTGAEDEHYFFHYIDSKLKFNFQIGSNLF